MAAKSGLLLGAIYNKRKDRKEYLHRRPSNCPGYAAHCIGHPGKRRSMSVPGINNTELYAIRHATLRLFERSEVGTVTNCLNEEEEMGIAGQVSEIKSKKAIPQIPFRRNTVEVMGSTSSNSNDPSHVTSHNTHARKSSVSKVARAKVKRHGSSGAGGGLLKAARSGNLNKVIDLLDNDNIDITTSNNTGLTALLLAAKEGHYDVITALLDRGASPDQATKMGNTGLHIASLSGNLSIVQLLLNRGADPNILSQNSFTPLYMAAQEGHASVVQYLVDHGADHNIATEDGFTPLAVALQEGRDAVVNLLLEKDDHTNTKLPPLHIAAKKDDVKLAMKLLQPGNPDDNTAKVIVNKTSESGFTALHIAAHYGNVNVGEVLVQRGAMVDFKARNGITPLHIAAKRGHSKFCAFLLDCHARPGLCTRDGLIPLHCAARSGHVAAVRLFLDQEHIPKFAKTKNGLSVLHMAAQGGHVNVVQLLLENGFDVDDVTTDYLGSLHIACHCGNVDVAKLLLDNGADVDAKAQNGFTPLHVACKKDKLDVAKLLLDYHADKDALTESGLSPLHIAAFMGNLSIVEFLLENRVRVERHNVQGETALDMASRARKLDTVDYLMRHTTKNNSGKLANNVTSNDVNHRPPP